MRRPAFDGAPLASAQRSAAGGRQTRAMTTVWITGDQLCEWNSALATRGDARSTTVVLMIESLERARLLPYHKRKLVLIYAAMREFAARLRESGWTVDYLAERESFESALAEHVAAWKPERVVAMHQSEYGATERLAAMTAAHGLELEVTDHTNFVSNAAEFDELWRGKSRLTMEIFYRAMRRKTGLLLDDAEPAGGQWNYDARNRKPPRADMLVPPEPALPERAGVREAIALVERHFPGNPGVVGTFDIPVTRADALAWFEHFVEYRLAAFGPYEDAMLSTEAVLYHSRISAPLNVGLVHPLELCERVEAAYRAGGVPLASAEGFIRQVIGWREFVWQTYWRFMPEYRSRNALDARLPLPAVFSTGETDMACVRTVLGRVRSLGWAHHIERLMILGNFMLLAGVDPAAANDWFWYSFVDGYEWVMAPNVIGMTLHADGGIVGTKPYAASAAYINKMSDYCKGCRYDRTASTGKDACPFTTLYWDFLSRHEARFAANPRMSLVLAQLRRKPRAERDAIRKRAAEVLEALSAPR
jgi:deoxyribodipyrimidine photolyase-related protein